MELKMEISQNTVLSQKMIQSAEILQMSSQELENYLKELAVENPVIDIEEDYMLTDREKDIERKIEWLESSDEQNRVYYSGDYSDEDNKDPWNFSTNEGEDLVEYLMSQLLTRDISGKDMEIMEYMVNCLDSKGYFEEDEKDICTRFNISSEHFKALLCILQSLEPAGICARNLSECLILQLDRKQEEAPAARRIIQEYLDLVGKNQLHVIAKKMKMSVEEILQECEVIKSLNPKPGSHFSSRENLKYITPDITVVKLSNYFEVLLNEYMYPKMSINSYYRKMLDKDTPEDTKNYISEKVRQAEWVMNCISQRNKTLLSVTKAIIDRQGEFFARGQGNLKPLKLADIAGMLGIHESTVSRAVRDKYLQCAWGIYPMNYFFTKGFHAGGGQQQVTPEDIKGMIVKIIDQEDKQKPYSDRIIAEKLQEDGVHLSRRTVAKYRESIGLKDASGRKVFI